MSVKANYFKIGLFVISSFILIVIIVVIFGAGLIFRQELIFETYIDGSVHGLQIGSPVEYRGVKVGEVKEITLVKREYGVPFPYVVIRSAIILSILDVKKEEKKKFISAMKMAADLGLRVRLTSMGLTGVAYLECDYLDPKRFPPLEIDWEPKYPYVPSAPSELTQITRSLGTIMNNLQEIDFKSVTDDVKETMKSINKEVRQTSQRINKILDKPEIDAIFSDTSKTMQGAQKLMTSLSKDVPETVANLKRTIQRIDSLVSNQQYEIQVILENIREISENLNELSENLKKYPSGTIFGQPPPRSHPGEIEQ